MTKPKSKPPAVPAAVVPTTTYTLLDYERRVQRHIADSLARCGDGPRLIPCRGATATAARRRASERRTRMEIAQEPGGVEFLGVLFVKLGMGEVPSRRPCPLCHGTKSVSTGLAMYAGYDVPKGARDWTAGLMECPRCAGEGEVDV